MVSRRPGRGDGLINVGTDGVAGTGNSSARVPEKGSHSGMPPVGEVDSFHSADLAGMAFPAFTGVASPVDLAGMAFPAIVGEISPTEIAGMALPAVAGVVPPAEFSKKKVPGRSRSGVAECCEAGGPIQYIRQSDGGSLVQDDMVTIYWM